MPARGAGNGGVAANSSTTVYSATYSNVPVYEYNVAGNHVMRRRSDDWINATHILKVADYDKPARTRILEREVQKGVHEKVQGGYGKYQGTWIPLQDGRELAAKNGVLEKLRPIFEFVPGDRSPPPAPKHETAATSKPRVPRASAAGVQQRKQVMPGYTHAGQDYDAMDVREGETPDNETVASESQFDEYDMPPPTTSRKRRRVEDQMSQADREHRLWADDLLDHFMLQDMDGAAVSAPVPPANANLDRPIDEKGYTALHWAAAMGDIEVVKDLIRRGASVDAQSKSGETPLMRSVIFTNCFDKKNMSKLAGLLIRTVNMQEWTNGSTVFHLIAAITQSRKKYECARYYMDCLLNKMTEVLGPAEVERVLNERDARGDTAITIAARNGARKCVRSLIGRNAAVDIMNNAGETADQLIVQLNHRRQERNRMLSSSPFAAAADTSMAVGGAVQPPMNGIPFDPLVPHTALTTNRPSLPPPTERGVTFKTEPALSLTTSILPTLVSKSHDLATALESEIVEKDAEIADAERVLALRKAEIDSIRRQAEEYLAREKDQLASLTKNDIGDEEEERELEELVVECETLLGQEDEATLSELVDAETQLQGDLSPTSSPPSPSSPSSSSPETRSQLAHRLSALYARRRELLKAIVRHLSMAGYVGSEGAEALERRRLYRRLITGALCVREQDVEALLPEIVAELEEWRGMGLEAGAAAAAAAAATAVA